MTPIREGFTFTKLQLGFCTCYQGQTTTPGFTFTKLQLKVIYKDYID